MKPLLVVKKKLDNKLAKKELSQKQILDTITKTKQIEFRKSFNANMSNIEEFTEWE